LPTTACTFEALDALAKFRDDGIVSDRTWHFGKNHSLGLCISASC
jgi:hypothetical protein